MGSIGWIVGVLVTVGAVAKFVSWRRDRQTMRAMEGTVSALVFLLAPDDMFPGAPGVLRCVRGNAEIEVNFIEFAEHWLKPSTDGAAIARCNRYLAGLIRRSCPGQAEKLRDELVAVVEEVAEVELVGDEKDHLVFESAAGDRVSYEVDHLLIDLWGELPRARERLMTEWAERAEGELGSAKAEHRAPRAVSTAFGRTRGTSSRGDLTHAPQRLH